MIDFDKTASGLDLHCLHYLRAITLRKILRFLIAGWSKCKYEKIWW